MRREHGGVRREHPEGLKDFSSNLNPWGPPEAVKRLFAGDVSSEIVPYPDPAYEVLRESIAGHTGRRPEEVFAANGSEEVFFWACRLLGPRRVLVIHPTFCEYAVASRAAGAEVEQLVLGREDGFRLRLGEALSAAARADLVFICNPNNPTGRLFRRDEIEALEDSLKQGAVLLVDEAFMDFVPGKGSYTATPLVGERVWVSGSLTKFYSLAGLRTGYLLASTGAVGELESIAPLWRVNRLAEMAAVTALADREYLLRTPQLLEEERGRFAALLEKTGALKVYPSSANFLLCEMKVSTLVPSELKVMLLKRGFLIRDASDFPGLSGGFIRLAVLGPEDNDALVTEVRRICTGRP